MVLGYSDMVILATGTDPVYGCHWYGESVDGPEGKYAWGIDAADNAVTGNTVNMDTYLRLHRNILIIVLQMVYPTKVFFTTGPVDDSIRYTG